MPTRRTFLETSAKAAAGAVALSSFPQILTARHAEAPSDQLNVGLIGCKSRGFRVLQEHLRIGGVNCVALCDIDANLMAEKAKDIEAEFGQTVQQHEDFRSLLEQKDIDAVIIGTPDHWHCLPTVYACQEGKDVYVEKPMANSIAECNLMVEAGKRYNRIIQVGQQQRSGLVWKGAMEYLASGKLGEIRKANIWANFNYGLGPKKVPNAAVPEGVNYDLFLGPAPTRPFNPARFHGSWRFFWDYGGGLMTDWGVHLIDMALWAKGITTPPKQVLAYGTQLERPELARETYDTMSVIYPYDDFLIQWEHSAGKQVGPYDRLYGIAFLGDNGTLVADRRGWQVYPEWDNQKKGFKIEESQYQAEKGGHDLHSRDFIEAAKTRTSPACPAELGRTVALCAHFANIALRTGAHQLNWDENKQKFIGNKAANQLITPEYRNPWSLPKL
ncbi:MAG: Gfo/Idh/MocA family oxidoreductase [Bacteroidota bacterium]